MPKVTNEWFLKRVNL